MKKSALVLLTLASLMLPAFAQDAAPKFTPPVRPRTEVLPKPDGDSGMLPPTGMTIAECLTVLGGLNQLDGHQVILSQGTPNEKVVTMPYEFNNGALRRDIQMDIVALQEVQKIAQTVQAKIFAEAAKGAQEIKNGTPEAIDYAKQINDASVQPCPAHLTRIKIDALHLEKNEIAGTVLAALDKILDK